MLSNPVKQAKNLRDELIKKYPDAIFTVRNISTPTNASILIEWVDNNGKKQICVNEGLIMTYRTSKIYIQETLLARDAWSYTVYIELINEIVDYMPDTALIKKFKYNNRKLIKILIAQMDMSALKERFELTMEAYDVNEEAHIYTVECHV